MMVLTADRLDFSYGRRQVLSDIAFAVDRKEMVAVLGNNGAGKSTLLKCLNGILSAEKGTVLINGKEVSNMTRLEVARNVGYVAQRYESSRVTVFDAVLLGRKPHMGWEVSKKDLDVTEEVLTLMGLESFALRYTDELSGGELQKVVVARALAQDPEVLLLDEPTSNLDMKNQLELLDILQKIKEEKNVAIILTMHDLNLALRYAEKFVLLKDSTVFAFGDRSVMTGDNIGQVYNVGVSIEEINGVSVVVPQHCLP